MQTILFGISSGIAAFKAIPLITSLRKKGYKIIVIMTEHAKKMLSPSEFEKASGNKIATELFPKGFDYKKVLKERKVDHISLADKADLIVVVPATANVIAKIANGIADDLLTTTILASRSDLLVCPSMNVNMWENRKTKNNIKRLVDSGALFVPPEKGMLACGYEGTGRLADIKKIEETILSLLKKRTQLKGKKIIVTAGGTVEPIDDVRVITNNSSGKMGIAIAEESSKRGAVVTLLRARTDVEPMAQIKDIRTLTSAELASQLSKHVKDADIVIHAAAVSDFTVDKKEGKIRSGMALNLSLKPNKKLIDLVKKINTKIFLVGFKAESNISEKELIKRAKDTLMKSDADIIVANDVSKSIFGSDHTQLFIVTKTKIKKLDKSSKKEAAGLLLDELVRIYETDQKN